MTIIVYGIKNCDTVKKALNWLSAHHVEHRLHDYRVDGFDVNWLNQAETAFGWEALVDNLDRAGALKVLAEQPTLFKRPIILQDELALIGFDEKVYGVAFS